MLVAHLPSGYITGRLITGRLRPDRRRAVMIAALIGSVLPDFDMLWFWLVDQGRVHHHLYWPHLPAVWLAVAVLVLPALRRIGRFPAGLAFFLALAVHMGLDTVTGGIAWAWPLSDHLYTLFNVPADYAHWIISFTLHWTFLFELAICIAAVLWIRRPQ